MSLERADGFQGPMIISDPTSNDEMQLKTMYDAEEIVFIQDWYHQDGNINCTGESKIMLSNDDVILHARIEPFILSLLLKNWTGYLLFELALLRAFSSMAVKSILPVWVIKLQT